MKTFTKHWTKLLVAVALAAPASLAATTVNAAAVAPQATVKYVALGDSLTVGYEPGMTAQSVPYGFVDRVYEQALWHGRATVQNYGIGGLTSTGLKNLTDAITSGNKVTADSVQPNIKDPRLALLLADTKQSKSQIAAANLITITIGGNDVISLPAEIPGKSDAEVQKLAEDKMKTYAANLTSVLQSIYAINPQANVYVLDQYQPYPPVDAALYQKLGQFKDLFGKTLDTVVAGFQQKNMQVKAAHASAAFIGHEIEYTHIMSKDIHPNQKGYDVLAQAFSNTIWGTYSTAKKQDPINIVVAGKQIETTYAPIITNDRTFVPVREYAQELGAQVEWNQATQTANVNLQGMTIAFTIGSDSITIAGQTKKLAAPVQMVNSKTYVPLRALAETLGLDVQWAGKQNTVFVNQ